MNAIEIRGLKKTYGDFTLGAFDLTLPSGCIMGLVGENGAGKSTTIKLIMDAIKRDEGSVRVHGCDNTSKEFRDIKEDIGVVLDEAYYPEVLNALNVNRMMRFTYKRWDEQKFMAYLKRFDLPEKKPFRDYSRGMRMKLAIAAALSHDAKLLILDEATSGLDPMIRDEILDIFNEFTRDEGHSVLLSSHIVSDLEKICDYIAFIHKGRLMLSEEKDVLLSEYAIVKVSNDDLGRLPKESVVSVKREPYGAEALCLKASLPSSIVPERTTLEEIILFLAREEG